jgi:uncharacterized cupin superfamily protein
LFYRNNKTSPSVTPANSCCCLKLPITFFETEFLKGCIKRPIGARQPLAYGTLADLGAGFARPGLEPFVVILEPQADSGDTPIVHTGLEFVFCLEGRIGYEVDGQDFTLEPGDSLLFEAYLPHSWCNTGDSPSRSLLMLCPADERDHPDERHFT